MVIESADIEFRANTAQAERGVENLDRSMERLASRSDFVDRKMKTWGRNMTRVFTTTGLALGAIGVGFNARVETLEAQFEVMTGSADTARQTIEDLTSFASRTPLQITGLANTAKNLMAFGSTSEEVLGQLQMLGDVAGGQQDKLDSVARAFGRVQAKGKASMEEINMIMEAGIPILAELSDNLGVTEAELFDLISAGEIGFTDLNQALIDLTSEGGQFNGMMERMSQTTQGKFSTAVDNAKIALGSLTESLMPIINDLLDGFTRLVQRFDAMSEGSKRLVLALGGIAIATGPLMKMFPFLRKSAVSLIASFKGFAQGAAMGFSNGATIIGKASRNMALAMQVARTGTTQLGVSVSQASSFLSSKGVLAQGITSLGTKIGAFAATLKISAGALLGWGAAIAGAVAGIIILIDQFTTSRREAMKMAREFKNQQDQIDSARVRYDELTAAQESNADIVRTLIDEYPDLREELIAYGDDVKGALEELERLNQAELERARRPFDRRIQQELDLLEEQVERREELARLAEQALIRSGQNSALQMTGQQAIEASINAVNLRLQEQYRDLSTLGQEAGVLTKSYDQLIETTSSYYGMNNLGAEEALEYIRTATFVLGDQHELTLQLIGTYGTIEELTARIAAQEKQREENTQRRQQLAQEESNLLRQMRQLAEQTDENRLYTLTQLRTQIRALNDLQGEDLILKRQALEVIQEEIDAIVERQRLEGLSDLARTREEIQNQINDSVQEELILRQLLAENQAILASGGQELTGVGSAQLEQAQQMVTYLEERLGITREEQKAQDETNDILEDRLTLLQRIADSNKSTLDELRDQLQEISGFEFQIDSPEFALQQEAIEELRTQIQEELNQIADDVSVNFDPVFETQGFEGYDELLDESLDALNEYTTMHAQFIKHLESGEEISTREINAMIAKAQETRDIVDAFSQLEQGVEGSLTRIEEIMQNFNVPESMAQELQNLSDDMIEAFLGARQEIQEAFGAGFFDFLQDSLDMSAEQIVEFNDIIQDMFNDIAQDILSDAIDQFKELGAAIASGQGAAEATANSIGQMIDSFVSNLPQMLLQAGLQMMGVDWRVGLALIAASGLVALGVGLFGGGAAARQERMNQFQLEFDAFQGAFNNLTDSIIDMEEDLRERRLDVMIDGMNEELDILRELNDAKLEILNEELDAVRDQARDRISAIEEGYGEELYLLKDQLDRNLISQQEYMDRVQDMIRDRDAEVKKIQDEVEAKEVEVGTAEDQAQAEEAAQQAEIERLQNIRAISDEIDKIADKAGAASTTMTDLINNSPFGGRIRDQLKGYQASINDKTGEIDALLERARGAGTEQEAQGYYEQAAALAQEIQSAQTSASSLLQPQFDALNTINRRLTQLRNYKETLEWWRFGEHFDTDKAIDDHLDAYNSIITGNIKAGNLLGIISSAAKSYDKLDISAAARGADFMTTGPQMLLVGDNPGGRERVQVTPMSSPNYDGPKSKGVTINFNGPVYGADADELAVAIHTRLKKLESRNLV